MTTGLPRHLTVIDMPGVKRRDVDLDLGKRQSGLVRVHLIDERPDRHGRANRGDGAGGNVEKVATGRLRMIRGVDVCQDCSPSSLAA